MANTTNPADPSKHGAVDDGRRDATRPDALEGGGETTHDVPGSATEKQAAERELGRLPTDKRVQRDWSNAGGTSSDSIKSKRGKGPRIESLEQFIAHAYSRKGRQITLKSTLERTLGAQSKLPPDARQILLGMSELDANLQVNRQLLLAAGAITTYPAVRGELLEYVGEVLLRHPAFRHPELQACIRNLPGAPTLGDALALLLETAYESPSPTPGKRRGKSQLRNDAKQGAAYCFAVWVAETRGISNIVLSDALYAALWAPAAGRIQDDIGRLRAITEVRDLAGVGTACAVFKERASEQMSVATVAERERRRALDDVDGLRAAIETLENGIAERDQAIKALNEQIDESRVQHETAMIHARDDDEGLRTRLLRRLRVDIALLEDGITAIRRESPKIHVMDDHASRVADALRKELKQLESGE